MEGVAELRQLALHLLIGLELVDEAALQPAAHAGELGLVEREVLFLRHADRDIRELVEPRRAAELTPARPYAGEELRLVPGAEPAQLDPRTESGRELHAERREIETGGLRRVEDDHVPAVELPVGAEDVDAEPEALGRLGGGAGRFLLAALVLRELEFVGGGRP